MHAIRACAASPVSAGEQALAGGEGPEDVEQFGRLLTELGGTVAAKANGEDKQTDWVSVFGFSRPPGREGNRRMVLAKPKLDNSSINRASAALDALREEMKGVQEEEPEGLSMHITGDPVLRQQELNDAFSGAIAASGLSFILVALSLVIGIRSGRLIAALLITLIIGSIWTTGLAALAVGRLNLISVAFMVLFFGLGVDFGTHLGLRFLEEFKKSGKFEPALKESMLGRGTEHRAQHALRQPGLPVLRADLLCRPRRVRHHLGARHAGRDGHHLHGPARAHGDNATAPEARPRVQHRHRRLGSAALSRHPRRLGRRHGRFCVHRRRRAGSTSIRSTFRIPKAEPVITFRDLAKDPQTSPYAVNVIAADLDEAHALSAKLAALGGVAGVGTAEDFLPKDQPAKLQIIKRARDELGPAFLRCRREAPRAERRGATPGVRRSAPERQHHRDLGTGEFAAAQRR